MSETPKLPDDDQPIAQNEPPHGTIPTSETPPAGEWPNESAVTNEPASTPEQADGRTSDDESPNTRQKAGRIAVNSLLGKFVGRDINRTTRTSETTLYGHKKHSEPSLDEKGKQKTDEITGDPLFSKTVKREHPVTGEEIDVPNDRQPLVPVTKRRETRLVGKVTREGVGSAETTHPRYRSIVNDLKRSNYRSAVIGVDQLRATLSRSASNRVGPITRAANSLAPQEYKRETQLRASYTNAMHEVYAGVSGIPNTFSKQEIESREGVAENRDWSAELDLVNIQAFRAHLIERWIGQHPKISGKLDKNPYLLPGQRRLEAGGALSMDPQATAAYLGVDYEALKKQMYGGKKVVPQIVLTKLNFFIAFADNTIPTEKVENKDVNTLPGKLADFLTDFKASDSSRVDGAPIQRVEELKKTQAAAANEQVAIPELPDEEETPPRDRDAQKANRSATDPTVKALTNMLIEQQRRSDEQAAELARQNDRLEQLLRILSEKSADESKSADDEGKP